MSDLIGRYLPWLETLAEGSKKQVMRLNAVREVDTGNGISAGRLSKTQL